MNNKKINLILIGFIIATLAGGFWYYRRTHPKYVPLPPRPEVTLTIIPGWNLRQVAEYLVNKGFASSTSQVYRYTGEPAKVYSKPWNTEIPSLANDFANRPPLQSFEGYLAPDTYQVYKDAALREIIVKLLLQRNDEVDYQEIRRIEKESGHSWHEILTMASLVEKEARTPEDMALVADIFWRRNKIKWALQSCATVNYITGKNDPAVSGKDKAIDSLYNTYKYPGLPPGPISNPGLVAITAVLYPTQNNYWYFMSDTDGKMHYAKTLEEHGLNRARFLN
ncbi:MAG: hypothetical protein UR53_C0002G0062 [Candidatus Magasanikbacteria bacterium GW2011_GWC2_34_16]|uniref:Aminodeoxychorismate lyase n=2 Tax=Candidatus Magasanikiibacteriota TaxID=1752731 RepID=A0A0G0HET4_9BACT|nr:MAG: hypothetical protein UR53_C0002G0062 [Candidatus Magasanikbacteria bacterium GW2011_GWC2_34_16]KKQ40707.1 MAG: hypothetical protein US58_C0013G0007 [Candidatus Magasanikbacteria bacterium GW2011_GWA2_37_8]